MRGAAEMLIRKASTRPCSRVQSTRWQTSSRKALYVAHPTGGRAALCLTNTPRHSVGWGGGGIWLLMVADRNPTG